MNAITFPDLIVTVDYDILMFSTEAEELKHMLMDMHYWAGWYPNSFIILTGGCVDD